jgi:hypothetical protein
MLGRPITEVAGIMASLHGLCGQSHAAAIRFAAAVASGAAVPAAADWVTRLAAERIGEHLRSLVLAGVLTAETASMREALAVAGRVARKGSAEALRLVEAVDRLGLDDRLPPDADGADVLGPEEDAALSKRLPPIRRSAAFARPESRDRPCRPLQRLRRHPSRGPRRSICGSCTTRTGRSPPPKGGSRPAMLRWKRSAWAAVLPAGRCPDGTLTEGNSLAPPNGIFTHWSRGACAGRVASRW